MDFWDRIQRPRVKIIHIMIVTVVLAIVFGALRSRPAESAVGVTCLFTLIFVWLLVPILRPDAVKGLLDDPPEDPDDLMRSLEECLATSSPRPVMLTVRATSPHGTVQGPEAL